MPPVDSGAVSFEVHIKPLFRDFDKKSMSKAFDLWSYDDVRQHARCHTQPAPGRYHALRRRLAPDKVGTFRRWVSTGMAP